MVFRHVSGWFVAPSLLIAVFLVAGCGEMSEEAKVDPESARAEIPEKAENDGHSGWWCVGHGIPEEVCSLCSSEAADEFKKAGDWCDEHDRADSQCFICNPERQAKFAAQYEAKFGRKPPEPQAE